MNINLLADQLLNVIYNNENIFEDGKKIGEEIYKTNGAKGLFSVMNIIEAEILNCEYSSEYLSKLRELEWSWCGITPEWQA